MLRVGESWKESRSESRETLRPLLVTVDKRIDSVAVGEAEDACEKVVNQLEMAVNIEDQKTY